MTLIELGRKILNEEQEKLNISKNKAEKIRQNFINDVSDNELILELGYNGEFPSLKIISRRTKDRFCEIVFGEDRSHGLNLDNKIYILIYPDVSDAEKEFLREGMMPLSRFATLLVKFIDRNKNA